MESINKHVTKQDTYFVDDTVYVSVSLVLFSVVISCLGCYPQTWSISSLLLILPLFTDYPLIFLHPLAHPLHVSHLTTPPSLWSCNWMCPLSPYLHKHAYHKNLSLPLMLPCLAFLYSPFASRYSRTFSGVSTKTSNNGRSLSLWIFHAISLSC
jgi:hypothetical protein